MGAPKARRGLLYHYISYHFNEVTGLPDLLDDPNEDSDSEESSDSEELWDAVESLDSEDGFLESLESDTGSDDVEVVTALVKDDPGDLVVLNGYGNDEEGGPSARNLGVWLRARCLKSSLHRWLRAPTRVIWRRSTKTSWESWL